MCVARRAGKEGGAAPALRASLPFVREAGLGPGCQWSSICYLFTTCALLSSNVSPVLAANMFGIFVFSLYYRYVLHHPAPPAWMVAQFRLAKKLDGFFIMHMSISWATGWPIASMAAAWLLVFGLGDPHALRIVVFGLSASSACLSLWRFGQHACAHGYVCCLVLSVGSFVAHAVEGNYWTAPRLWLWHGGTAVSFALACMGMGLADASSRGYQTRGFLYVG